MKSINNYITHKALITKNTKLRPITNYYIVLPYNDLYFSIYYDYKQFEVEVQDYVSVYICNTDITKEIVEKYINKLTKDLKVYKIPETENLPNNIQKTEDIDPNFINKLKDEFVNPFGGSTQKYKKFCEKYKEITKIKNIN